MLAKGKLDSIETLVSHTVIDQKIRYEEFNAIIREKQKNERMKENVRMPVKNKKIRYKKPTGKYWSPVRSPPISPGRRLKILFDRPGDVQI